MQALEAKKRAKARPGRRKTDWAALTDDNEVRRRRLAGTLPQRAKPLRVIDLFSGAGGFTMGFAGRAVEPKGAW